MRSEGWIGPLALLGAALVATGSVSRVAASLALQQPGEALLAVELASRLKADYSRAADPAPLAPLSPAIVSDAAGDAAFTQASRRAGQGNREVETLDPTAMPTPSLATASPTAAPTGPPSPTATPRPTATPTQTASRSPSPVPTSTPTPSPVPTSTPTPSPVPTSTPTPSPGPTKPTKPPPGPPCEPLPSCLAP